MKHISYFNDFLANHVNLNQSRLNMLEERVETITNLLKSKLAGYRKYSPQGSYAHKTIIKPVQDNDEFDADVLIFIKDDNFNPDVFNDYIRMVYDTLKSNHNYKDKIKEKTRCVTIDYAGDFHLDIVPCVERRDVCYICNRDRKVYEKTDGDGYKEWLIERNRIIGGNNFRKATRLFKFLRDHKDNFSVKSILLTTILGNEVRQTDENSGDFSDLPTTLKILSNRVNVFLKRNNYMPIIKNPVLPSEDFNRHWDQRKYANFRDKFDIYNSKINEACAEKSHDESIKKWRKLFGDDFGKLRESNKSGAISGGATVVAGGVTPPVIARIPDVPATKPYAYDD